MTATRLVDRYEPVLGTLVEIRVELAGEGRDDEADALSTAMVGEMVRLQSILSSVDQTSEFSRWCRGEVTDPSAELVEVLTLAAAWQQRSSGRFNPAVGVLTRAWRDAEASGAEPDAVTMDAIVADIAAPRWIVEDGRVLRRRDASDCTLNALAKGWIADRAVEIAAGVDGLVLASVNAGGDIATRGSTTLGVGIEDPATPWDNAPPLTVIGLPPGGLATSGAARRGFEIAGAHHSHVLDPRSGRPVDATASITVVATSAADADALATMFGVSPPDDALAEATAIDLACLMVTADGRRLATERWRALEQDVS